MTDNQLLTTATEDKKVESNKTRYMITSQIEAYAERPYITFSYGVDELLNTIDATDIESLKLSKKHKTCIYKIRQKRLRFLRTQLLAPNNKPQMIKAIELAITYETEQLELENGSKNNEGITIEFVSNLGGNDEQD